LGSLEIRNNAKNGEVSIRFSKNFLRIYDSSIKQIQKEMIKKYSKEEKENKKINVRIAILGGGDVVFPIITSGIFLINYGFSSAIFIFVGATLGLSYIFFSEKRKTLSRNALHYNRNIFGDCSLETFYNFIIVLFVITI
jgi:hypothetical protein